MGVFFLNFFRSLKTPTKNLLLRTTLFFVYLLFGGALFQTIESGAEKKEKVHFDQVRKTITAKYNISQHDMAQFFVEINKAIEEGYFDVEYDRWSFAGSVFFSGTVVTTIGYGRMAPATFWGRLFCMFYALFGIPITGLMLKSIGERITEGIASLMRFIDRRLLEREPRGIHMKTVICVFLIVVSMLLILAALAMEYEGWTFFEGVYFGFITLSTIGFGDYVPAHPSKDESAHPAFVILFTAITFLYFTVGLALVSSALLAISRLFEDEPPWGFISLMNQGEQDDDDDDDGDEVLKEKLQAKKKTALTSEKRQP